MTRPMIGIALAFATATISGFSLFLNSFAVRAFGDPTLYTMVKNLIAGLCLMALLAIATRTSSTALGGGLTRPHGWRESAGLLAVGVLGGGVAFILFFQGLTLVAAADAALIHKTLVLWVALLAVVVLRERFTPLHGIAVAALMAGQILSTRGLGTPQLELGSVMILAATLIWSGETVVARALLQRLSPLTVGVARMGIGSAVLAAIVLASGGVGAIGGVPPEGWLWAVATGVILTAYVATWFNALARAQAIDVAAVLVFGAVITSLLSAGSGTAALGPVALGLVLIALGAAGIAATVVRTERAAA